MTQRQGVLAVKRWASDDEDEEDRHGGAGGAGAVVLAWRGGTPFFRSLLSSDTTDSHLT